jgi:hypothetical protein
LEIYALCPFRVGTLLWEAQPGQLSLTVTVKATFRLVPGGEATVAPEQDDLGDDRHWDDDARASLFQPGDLVPLKRRVDVVLVGHAYAPGGTPTRSMVARLRFGDIDKSIQVTGDRLWTQGAGGLVAGAPIPFVRMPLQYERAALAPDNPVGLAVDGAPQLGTHALPNLERLDDAGRPTPGAAGFGPIASTWRARRKLVDEAALFWAYGASMRKRSMGPAPAGFDFEFFNAAPREQQLDLFRSGLAIELQNMRPAHPLLTTQLPAMKPQVFRVHPRTGRVEEIALRCDTLWIDTDRAVVALAFRGLTDLGGADERAAGKLVVVADPQGKKLRFDKVEKQLLEEHPGAFAASRPASSVGSPDLDPLALRYDSVKPSRPATSSSASLPRPPSSAVAEPPPPPPAPPGPHAAEPTQRFDLMSGFHTEAPAVTMRAPHEEEIRDRTRDVAQHPRHATPALPFQVNPYAPAASVAAPAAPATLPPPPSRPPAALTLPSPGALLGKLDLGPPAPQPRTEPPPRPPAPATTPPPRMPAPAPLPMDLAPPRAAPTIVSPAMLAAIAAASPIAAPPISAAPPIVAPPSGSPQFIPTPTLLGPGAVRDPASAPARSSAPSASSAISAAPPTPAKEPEPEPGPENVTLSRYAAISAELAQKGVDRGSVLRHNKLSIGGWGAVDRHWKRAIAEQTERGERGMLNAFDTAYVAAQERLRRPIGVPEYARILVGLERGEVGRVLADLELQLSDLMRLQRVWTKRVADVPALAAELARAVESARRS